jgi:hypothetical protein
VIAGAMLKRFLLVLATALVVIMLLMDLPHLTWSGLLLSCVPAALHACLFLMYREHILLLVRHPLAVPVIVLLPVLLLVMPLPPAGSKSALDHEIGGFFVLLAFYLDPHRRLADHCVC